MQPAGRLRIERWDAGVSELPPGTEYGPYEPRDFEFIWVVRGRAAWVWEDVRIELPPGRLVLVRRDTRSTIVGDPRQPTHQAFAEFRVLDGAEALGPVSAWPLQRPLTDGGPLRALCDYLVWLAAADTAVIHRQWEDVIAVLLRAFVRGVLPRSERESPLPEALARMLDHVRQTWADEGLRAIGIDELARAANVSHSHLSRTFRREFGTGAVAALEQVRLGHAAMMLTRTNLSVAAVGRASGFPSQFYFSRRFRRAHGVPPSAFRAATGERPRPPAQGALAELTQRLTIPPPY